MNAEQDLEETLKTELLEGSTFPELIVVGQRGSGKTTFVLKIMNMLLTHPQSKFKKFHVVSPVAKFEQNDSYAFLSEWAVDKKKDKCVYIYPKFKDTLLAAICARQMEKNDDNPDGPSDLFVWVDDAVAADSIAIQKSMFLSDLTATLRHRRCVLCLCSHSITAATAGAQTGVLGCFTRQQASCCGNAKLIESFFLEYMSLISCVEDRGTARPGCDLENCTMTGRSARYGRTVLCSRTRASLFRA